MTKQSGVSISRSVILAIVAISSITVAAHAWPGNEQGSEREEFHKVYPLSAQGHVEIANVNGPVHITAWDRPEVKVDAVKSAWSKERLDEAKIEVKASPDRISIRTEYPGHDHTFNYGGDGEHNNPARVEYTITVPRQANLDEIKLVNGTARHSGRCRRRTCFVRQWTPRGAEPARPLRPEHGEWLP